MASLGGPADIEKLVELTNRRNKDEEHTSLAVEELSLIDKRKGIQVAATRLAECANDNSYRAERRRDEFVKRLRSLNSRQVLAELSKMDISEEVLFRKILIPWLGNKGAEIASEYLKRIGGSDSHSEDTKHAWADLDTSFTKSWFDGEYLQDSAIKIRTLLEKDQIDPAAECLDKSISSYSINYDSTDLCQTLDALATVCNEKLLDKWFENEKEKSSYSLSKKLMTLGLLGRGPGGRVIEEKIINWAESLDFDHLSKNWKPKIAVLGALGELGTPRARQTLLAIFQRVWGLRKRIRLLLTDDSYGFWELFFKALGKIGEEQALSVIQREAKRKWGRRPLVLYHIAAESLIEKDSYEAFRLLLTGLAKRGWTFDYRVEPQLRDFALRFGARISTVNQNGTWYVATSQSKNFRLRIRG